MELIPEKGYNAITIKDITERATLNRATFYLHYRDKDDLLYQGMREVLDELTSKQELPQELGDRLSYEESRNAVKMDFEHIAENAAFYKVMLGDNGVWGFVHELQNYIYEVTLERLLAIRGEIPSTPVEVELLLRYMAGAYVGVFHWWLENDMPYTPEEMADKLMVISRDGLYRCLGYQVEPDSFSFS
jgi:AcrR family transcriptional regulator